MNQSQGDRQMLAEILNQPNAWAGTIDIVKARADRLAEIARGADEVIFTGCGSGLNAANAAAPVFQFLTARRARAVPAAEIVFFPETVFVPGSRPLVVAFSRSGSTTETVLARDAARRRGMQTVAVTCRSGSPLARESTEALVLEPGAEESVTTTQSLTSMVLCAQLLAGIAAGNREFITHLERLPAIGRGLMDHFHDLGRAIGQDESIRKFAFVASGPLMGLARESQLKIKEMVLLPADSYPLLDYRHGPKSNVDEHMLVTVFTTDRTRAVEEEFLSEMKSLGGRLLVACDVASEGMRASADHVAETRSGLPDFARDILFLLPVHFLAYYKSLAEGQSPSSPRNLTYWVETSRLGPGDLSQGPAGT